MSSPRRHLLALAALAAVCALAAPSAFASTNQVSIVQDNNAINQNPVRALTKMRQMGFTMVKYAIAWNAFAPAARSTTAPANLASASTYDPSFAPLDQIDQDAQKVGIRLGFMVTSPAPRWAEGTGCAGLAESRGTCKPSDTDFRDFVAALGARYNGSVSGIPAVRWWSIWNEPNYIPNLAPELSATAFEGPDLYRGLLDAAWTGLTATGHSPASDTILFGELAPRGISAGPTQDGAGYKPVAFLDDLYCVSDSGERFGGRLASANHCGSSAAAFKRDNPALFDASGVADHPISEGIAPDVTTADCTVGGASSFCPASRRDPADPDWANLAQISNLETGLGRDLRAYGSNRKYPIWNTEYGYWTSPPGRAACHSASSVDCDLSQAKAAYFLNWSEYISYENPRIASFAQYQLYDPTSGGWTDGLLTRRGVPKATFDAEELPLYLPSTTARAPGTLTVWGGARPAAYDAEAFPGTQPAVAVQFKARSGAWRTVKTVTVDPRRSGSYFSAPIRFTASGSVRLALTVGASTIHSRTQAITVG